MPRLLIQRTPVNQYEFRSPVRPHAAPGSFVHGLRLVATIRLGATAEAHHTRSPLAAQLDTGSPITLFPYHVWEAYVHEIEWLHRPEGPRSEAFPVSPTDYEALRHIPHFDGVVLRYTTVRGHRCPALLGRIPVSVWDGQGNQLGPHPIVALFRFDHDSGLDVPLLGLEWGVLESRRLLRNHMEPHLYDHEREAYPSDWGPDHAQFWHLSEYAQP